MSVDKTFQGLEPDYPVPRNKILWYVLLLSLMPTYDNTFLPSDITSGSPSPGPPIRNVSSSLFHRFFSESAFDSRFANMCQTEFLVRTTCREFINYAGEAYGFRSKDILRYV